MFMKTLRSLRPFAALSALFTAITLSVSVSPSVRAEDAPKPAPSHVVAGTPADSVAFANAAWEVTDLGKGAEARYAQVRMFDSVQSISIVSYPARNFRTGIVEGEGMTMGETVVKRGHANHAMHTSVLAKAGGARFAVNGNYFNTKLFTPTCYTRIGRRVFGRTTAKEVFRTNGIMVIGRCGHKMDIYTCDTLSYDATTSKWHTAIAAGPMLMEDGKVITYSPEQIRTTESFYNWRHPRSLIGYTTDAKGRPDRVYMIVIDGRFPGQGEGASIAECACICRLLGMTDAINLDGGGSSTLWTDETGVINHPYDNKKWDHAGERRVPNILIAR